MEELLLKLKKLDVRIRVENDNLKLNIPESVDETLFIDDIRAHKHELIDFIQKRVGQKLQHQRIPKSTKNTDLRLTPAQGRLFVLQELAKSSNAYNIPFAFEINGVLDVQRLEDALKQVIQRHESLRTSFALNEQYQPIQQIAESVDFKLQFTTCTETELAEIIEKFSQPFDLEKAPLLKAHLLQTAPNTYILLVDVHHIIFDGLSFQVFLQDIAAIYMGVNLPPLSIQYKDYADWYYSSSYQEYLLNQKKFWLQELSGYSNTAILPTDFHRSNEISFEGEQVHFTINAQRKQIIDSLKKNSEASLFSVLLSLFGLLQSKLTGTHDLVVGTPVAGRRHEDLNSIIGMFVNTLGIRFNPRPDMNYVQFLKEVSQKTLKCFDHQEYPYEELLGDLGLSKSNEVNPLFNTMITLNNIPQTESTLDDFDIKPYEIRKSTSKFDLMIHFSEREDDLGCSFEYSTGLFKRETIEQFFNYLNNIIDQIGENQHVLLEKISLLDKETYQDLLQINDFADVEYPDTMTLVTMFEAQVEKTPEQIALQLEGNTMTYQEVNAKANQVARLLKNKGVQRGDIIGLLTGKTFETIIGMLGILKSGGAYLPIDVAYPEKRISYTLESSGAKLLLSLKEHKHLITNDAISFVYIEDTQSITDVSNPIPVNTPQDLCYVLYTSGTTGNPKGAMLEHKNVVRLLFNDKFEYDLKAGDVWTMFHSHCFDVSVWEMYGALLTGGKLIIISPETARDPQKYLAVLHENEVNIINQTPTAFYNLIGEANKQGTLLPKMRYVLLAGEALLPSKLKDWHTNHPNTKLINTYGITEVCVFSTYKEIGTSDIQTGISNIGRSLQTGAIYLLDNNLQPVPKGVIGEIYIGGAGVGRGYLNNESLTNDRFIKNPYKADDRLYKSGDLAVLLENGDIEYKGRSDHQIQLRGFRIELGEIENQLFKHTSIENVIVLDKKDQQGDDPYLCAYFVSKEELATEDLRDFLAETLPTYMIPAYFMRITKMPYTSSNKVDKAQLPAPKSAESSQYKAPENTEQEAMVEIWMKVLSASKIGIRDNYFVLGGDSLKAIGLIAETNEKLGSSLTIADIYEHQTIEKLGAIVNRGKNIEELLQKLEKLAISIGVENNALKVTVPEEVTETSILDEIRANEAELIDYIQRKVGQELQHKSIPKSTKDEYAAIQLTPSQGRLFVLQELAKGSTAYNVPFAFEINGTLDIQRLESALTQLIQRHEGLRTSFMLDDQYQPVQQLEKDTQFTLLFDKCTETELDVIIQNFSQPFDLGQAPLLKAHLVQLASTSYILLIDVHHIVFDGLSLQVFVQDLAALYKGVALPKLPIQYKDYADWYYTPAYQEHLLNQKSFWLQELSGYANTAVLPTDFIRSNELSFEGEQVHFKISAEQKQIIDNLRKNSEDSLFSVLFSLFGLLQSKLTGSDDLVIGTPVAGRRHTELNGIIGMFVNTLGLRINPKPNMGFAHFLKEVGRRTMMCLDHQEYPYEELLEDLDLHQTNEVNPLFNTMITLNNIPTAESKLEDFEIKSFEIKKATSKFDLMIHFSELEDGLGCSFEYSTHLFKRETIELFFNYLTNIIDQIGENKDVLLEDISLLDKATYNELLELNDFTDVKYPDTMTLVTMFEAQVEKTPEHTALQFEGNTMTYSQLNAKANQVARMLKNKGVQRGDIVGLLTGKTFETIIGMLGILKAGGAYMPIDVTYPEKRISYTLESSGAKLLLSLKEFTHLVQRDDISLVYIEDAESITDKSNPQAVNTPHDLCYVLYTSGTTGNPKGVMIEHNNVVRLLFNDKFQYDFGENDVWTMFHSHCFDVSVWEMYGAFLNGGKLILISPDIARDPKEYLSVLHENKVTILNQTPTAFYNLAGEVKKQGVLLPNIRYVVFAGEALSPTKLIDWHANHPNAKLINMYGITEVTVHMTYKEIGTYEIQNGISNIGRPLHTGSIYLLDDNLQPVPKGVIGEIYVGGEGVGRGYLNNESLTNSRFISNPHKAGDRLYKSGDLAVLLHNGELEYKGRSDHQIQLRGFRIELGEIENQLLKHKSVENVIVLDKRDQKEDQPYLCAYFVAKEELAIEELRNFLAEVLPHYMIPAYFMQITNMPYTSNNKVDKSKLPSPKPMESSEYKAPETQEQQVMAAIWMKVLGATKVGIRDNYFVLGGDSLKAIGLISEINEQLGCSLGIADIYVNQTIEELSSFIKKEKNNNQQVYFAQAEENIKQFEEAYRAKGLFKDNYEAVYPMNGVEIGMAFHTLKEKVKEESIHSIVYHEQNIYPIFSNSFDVTVFRRALDLMLQKHSGLRKIYDLENLAHIVLKEVNPEISFMDISHLSRDEQEVKIAEKKHEERLKGTQLDFDLVWRMTIIKSSDSHHYLLFDFHHSLFGGWSLNSFMTELNNVFLQLLQDESFKPALLRSTYRDQILGEIAASLDEQNIAYWREELDGYQRLEFADTKLEHEYIMDKYELGSELRKELEKVAANYNTSFKHLCFAAYVYAMKMFSASNDVTVGIVANNRPLTPDGDKLLGCFLNTIPFRAHVPENVTWADYITYIENKFRTFKKHEKVPFYKILEFTEEAANDRNAVFDTSFNYIDFHVLNDMVREEVAESIEEGVTGFDNYVNNNTIFDVHVDAANNGFLLCLAYSTTIIDQTLSSRIYAYFKAILHNFINNQDGVIDQNSVLDKQQKRQIAEFNNTAKAFDEEKTLTAWFAEQVAKTPDAIAVSYEDSEMSYAELDAESNQLARQLQDLGVGRNSVVGIIQHRSAANVISILGIMKAGGAYLPIDHTNPASRVSTMIADSNMLVLITDANTDEQVVTEIPRVNISKKAHKNQDAGALALHNESGDLLYVLYTSGSTGKPKGVMLTHKNLINLLDYHIHSAKVNTKSVLQFTPLIFDPSFKEIFTALVTGGAVHLISEEASKDFTAILKKIQEKQVGTIFMPNSILNQLFNSTTYAEELPTTLTNIISAGEQVVVGDLFKEYLIKHHVYLHNHYGPAETHVVTAHKMSPTEGLPKMPHIGCPIQNTQIHILSEGLHMQPIGIPGEIYIGGTQVGLGYLNRPDLTAERFIPNPYGNDRLYKTGDLGSWNADGSITFLGRKDFQVKLNGVRIELGEIECQLNDVSGISDSVVLLQEVAGNKVIVGYYLAEEKIAESTLKTYLTERLPINMVPSHYVHMDEFPKTATGKLATKLFPLPGVTVSYVPPMTAEENELVAIWAEVLSLDVSTISIDANFFDLGGNSLKAMVMMNMLNKAFSIEITLKELFEKQTIKAISDYIITIKQMESAEEMDISNAKLII